MTKNRSAFLSLTLLAWSSYSIAASDDELNKANLFPVRGFSYFPNHNKTTSAVIEDLAAASKLSECKESGSQLETHTMRKSEALMYVCSPLNIENQSKIAGDLISCSDKQSVLSIVLAMQTVLEKQFVLPALKIGLLVPGYLIRGKKHYSGEIDLAVEKISTREIVTFGKDKQRVAVAYQKWLQSQQSHDLARPEIYWHTDDVPSFQRFDIVTQKEPVYFLQGWNACGANNIREDILLIASTCESEKTVALLKEAITTLWRAYPCNYSTFLRLVEDTVQNNPFLSSLALTFRMYDQGNSRKKEKTIKAYREQGYVKLKSPKSFGDCGRPNFAIDNEIKKEKEESSRTDTKEVRYQFPSN